MPQLSLYVDDSTMQVLRASARGEGVSMSKYASGLIRARAQYGGWPQGYWENVYGCLEEGEMPTLGGEGVDQSLDDACDWFEGRPMYLLDSCVCIDLMRGKLPIAYDLMRQSDPKLFGVPAVVAAELAFGAEKSVAPDKTRLKTERFLAPFSIVPFNAGCARAYGAIRDQLRRDGSLIGPNDLLIAATAVANQATLVSNNSKEFHRVNGLRLESWYEIDL